MGLTETLGTLNVSHLRRAVRPRETLTKLDTATEGSPGDQQIDVGDLESDSNNERHSRDNRIYHKIDVSFT